MYHDMTIYRYIVASLVGTVGTVGTVGIVGIVGTNNNNGFMMQWTHVHLQLTYISTIFYYIKTKSRLSVCPSVRTFFATLITLPSRDVSTPDLLEM